MRYWPSLNAEQTKQLIEWSLQGRQNAYKRAIRKDAEASLESTACAEASAKAWHRLFSDPARMPVVSSDPSPMNPRRKMLTLACGHEVWSGVRRQTAPCGTCQAARKETA